MAVSHKAKHHVVCGKPRALLRFPPDWLRLKKLNIVFEQLRLVKAVLHVIYYRANAHACSTLIRTEATLLPQVMLLYMYCHAIVHVLYMFV